MKVVSSKTLTHADRQKQYRTRQGSQGRANNASRMRKSRALSVPRFVGVDSEGIGRGKNHRAVLLGVGESQFTASDTRKGLHWKEVFEFLYGEFERDPKAAYVGFYLSYDFNQWLKSLPIQAARLLLTKQGRELRKLTDGGIHRRQYHPVRVDGWEMDLLGFKRLSIRPRVCTCIEENAALRVRKLPVHECQHEKLPWMHICDAGSFFQMGFAKVLDPALWKNDPDGPICSADEWAAICKGKDKRATAKLNEEMRFYNRLENVLLGRVMDRLARAFNSIGIRLAKDQWYGPGSTASQWLRSKGAMQKRDLDTLIPDWFSDACRKSYFGGWFEIFSHGIIPGSSFNYDINNAYPFSTAQLPHICDKCRYRQGHGEPPGNSAYVLVQATVFGSNQRIGPVPYRDSNGSILRPSTAKGWYWLYELEAAKRANLVKKVTYHEWIQFIPCGDDPPFADIRTLYELRLSVGKASAKGLAIKLNNNSLYGKFAQSVGSAPYNNWFYASYITSYCRTQILDAIATHPGGTESVLMVATDGICFDSPHPTLPVSTKLGEWEATEYIDLCLFKPGVYWHRLGIEALLQVKSRGVPKEEFKQALGLVEDQFWLMHQQGGFNTQIPGSLLAEYGAPGEWALRGEQGWPHFRVPVKFRMKSCKQALNEGKWNSAAEVQEQVWLLQDSDPQNKRRRPRYNPGKRRIDTIIHDLSFGSTETKYYGEVKYPTSDIGFGWEGAAIDPILETAGLLRGNTANYDLPLGEGMEWETVWGNE
jgi:hypothetical protein